MTTICIAIGTLANGKKFATLASERAWLPLGPWPWRFQGGTPFGYTTPMGSEIHCVDQTMLGVWVLTVNSDRDGLFDELVRLLDLTTLDKLEAAWTNAKDTAAKVRALLNLAGAQAMNDGVVIPAFEAAVRAGLDDAESIVRLTAIRSLAVAPMALGKAVLEGRDDPDNPKIHAWYELFAGASGQA